MLCLLTWNLICRSLFISIIRYHIRDEILEFNRSQPIKYISIMKRWLISIKSVVVQKYIYNIRATSSSQASISSRYSADGIDFINEGGIKNKIIFFINVNIPIIYRIQLRTRSWLLIQMMKTLIDAVQKQLWKKYFCNQSVFFFSIYYVIQAEIRFSNKKT